MRVSITTLSEPGSKISATWSLPVIHLLVIVTVVGLSCSLARLAGEKPVGSVMTVSRQRHASLATALEHSATRQPLPNCESVKGN